MNKIILAMVNEIKSNIKHDLGLYPIRKCEKLVELLLSVYNTYQDDERDGVDYIFAIDNPEDLERCVKGGLSAKEIARIYNGAQSGCVTKWFYFGQNYESAQSIASYSCLIKNLIGWLDEILPYVLAYPYRSQSYQDLYTLCITDYMENNQFVS